MASLRGPMCLVSSASADSSYGEAAIGDLLALRQALARRNASLDIFKVTFIHGEQVSIAVRFS